MQSATATYQLDFNTAKQRIQNVALRTPLQLNLHLSKNTIVRFI